MSQRLNAVIPDHVNDALIEIAKAENRTKSQMAGMLLELGIKAWHKNNKASSDKENEE
jgi:CopG-like RHH_1 or ribbon-helix-helix domain, RHH_5